MSIQEIILPFDAVLPNAKILRAGSISCMFESGNIRYVKIGEIEILSMIYGAVRDENWGTVPCKIKDEKITKTDDGFIISYTGHYVQNDINYEADFVIEGKSANSIIFSMKGRANTNFKINRIGICIHHPINECREKKVIITKPDGIFYRSEFPNLISPELIFKQIKKMQWETEGNLAVHLLFDGAVFETEDQRNWSDSSYKTYAPPLTLPNTTEVTAGDTILQTFTLRLSGLTNKPAVNSDKLKKRKISFPSIGYSRQPEQPALAAEAIKMLSKIPFDHYRVTLFLKDSTWVQQLQVALAEAYLLNTLIQLVIYFDEHIIENIKKIVFYLKDNQTIVQHILILQYSQTVTPPALLKQVYPLFKKDLPQIKIGYGAAFSFSDLNKAKPLNIPCDFISFGFNPQVHAIDTRSFMESVQNQQDMMETLKKFADGKEIHIGPVTLGDTDTILTDNSILLESEINKSAISKQNWLTTWWTLLTIQNCGTANSISFFQLFGAQGLLQLKDPVNGAAPEIEASPLYEMLVAIKTFKPVMLVKRIFNDSVMMDGLLLENKKHDRLYFKVPDEILNFKKA